MQEVEGPRHRAKGKQIPRSDSVGSGSGRKLLVPTLSDPATRPDKERTTNKKRNNRTQGNRHLCTIFLVYGALLKRT